MLQYMTSMEMICRSTRHELKYEYDYRPFLIMKVGFTVNKKDETSTFKHSLHSAPYFIPQYLVQGKATSAKLTARKYHVILFSHK